MRNRKLCHIRPSMAFWPEVTKSRDRKRTCREVALSGSRLCACPAFYRAFFLVVVVTWLPKVTWPLHEVALTGSRFCACPAFFRVVFLSSSTMTTGCDRRSLDPFGVHFGMRNRKLCNTRRSSKQCWFGYSLRRPRPITIGNPWDMNYLFNPYMPKSLFLGFSNHHPPRLPTSYL
jgi:hypothetical protein